MLVEQFSLKLSFHTVTTGKNQMNQLNVNQLHKFLSMAAVIGGTCLFGLQPASAALTTETWQMGSTTSTGAWETGTNWSGGTAPLSNSYEALFSNGSTTDTSVTIQAGGDTVGFVNFTAGSYTIGGGTLTIDTNSSTNSGQIKLTASNGSSTTELINSNFVYENTGASPGATQYDIQESGAGTLTFGGSVSLAPVGTAGNTGIVPAGKPLSFVVGGGGTINTGAVTLGTGDTVLGVASVATSSTGTVNFGGTLTGVTTLDITGYNSGTSVTANLSVSESVTNTNLGDGAFATATGSSALYLTGQNIALTGAVAMVGSGSLTGSQTLGSNYTGMGSATNSVSGAVTLDATTGDTQTFYLSAAANNILQLVGVISGGLASGEGALTIVGPGTVNLTKANTYLNATTVTGGTLLLTNTSGSGTGNAAVSVAATGTANAYLGGTGSASGAVTAGGGTGAGTSIIYPGVSGAISNFSLKGGATLTTNSGLEFNLNTAGMSTSGFTTFGLGHNADADLLSITGGLTLGSAGTLTLNDLGTSTALAAGDIIALATTTTGIAGTLSGYADGTDFTYGANTFQINYGTLSGYTNDLTLDVVAAPEPSTVALTLGGLGFLFLWARRRRQAV